MPRIALEPRFQVEYLSILDSDGNLDTALEPKLADTDLRSLYRAMLLGRRLDERMVRLQRQGRIGTFAPTKGQEAAQMGSVFSLRPTDWMVPSFREKALAYGLPGIQVDGNDVFAVYAAAREAVERARAGDGPTLIECVTYRLGVHTTADDPTKYRSEAEVAMWEQKDPLTRFRAYLEKRNLLEEGLEQRVDDEIAEAIRRFEAMPPANPLTMFDHVYAELPPDLRAQRDEMAARENTAAARPDETSTHQPGATPMRGQRLTRR